MKTVILLYIKKIIHYIWQNKESIYSNLKIKLKNGNIKIDGKTNINEIFNYLSIISTSGLIEDKNEDEKIYFGAISEEKLDENKNKKLVQYDQSSWACVIYSVCRTFTYNTGIQLTRDEVEGVKKYAETKGWWKDKKGMSFRSGLRALAGWLKVNKDISIRYDRIFYGTDKYNERKKKGYMCLLGGYMTNKYVVDFKTDGIINQVYTWIEKKRYGHAFTEKEQYTFVDNYPSKFSFNIYTNTKWKEFIKHKYSFSTAYFIFLKEGTKLDKEFIESKKGTYEKIYGKDLGIKDYKSLYKATQNKDNPKEAIYAQAIIAKSVIVNQK